MLALFYRPAKLRLVWHEQRSRVLLACLAVQAEGPARGQVGLPHVGSTKARHGGLSAGRRPANADGWCRLRCGWSCATKPGVACHGGSHGTSRSLSALPAQMVWVANVHLEGSPYRPNDRISQLRHGLQRLEHHMGSREGARRRALHAKPLEESRPRRPLCARSGAALAPENQRPRRRGCAAVPTATPLVCRAALLLCVPTF